MRKKLWKIFAVLSVILAVGTTAAMMLRRSAAMENTLIPAEVSCEVNEIFDGNTKSEITVKNTGNIDSYVRIRLVAYWMKAKDGEMEISGEGLQSPELLYDDENWERAEDGTHTYYYKKKLAPEESTGNLLKEPYTLMERTFENGEKYQRVIEVFAEAVQAEPEKAIAEAWGVQPPDMTPVTEH